VEQLETEQEKHTQKMRHTAPAGRVPLTKAKCLGPKTIGPQDQKKTQKHKKGNTEETRENSETVAPFMLVHRE
jgi:hypothetical protein